MKLKKCIRCNNEMDISNFRKTNKGFYISYCNNCEKKMKNEYYLKHKNNKYQEYKNYKIEDLPNEIWKDIEGYNGLYQISNFGRVKSLTRISSYYNALYGKEKQRIRKAHIMKTHTPKNRYTSVVLTKNGVEKTFTIHRLVAEAFIPNLENKEQVNHIDGNKSNNCVDNLEFCTPSENNKHAFDTGLNKPHNQRKVNQYDLNNNYIKTWNSIIEFLKENNINLKNSGITSCCKGKQKTAYGYKWKYADDMLQKVN